MRQGFKDVVAGWMFVNDFNAITQRIEEAAEWAKENGPLERDEAEVATLMIKMQITLGDEVL